MFEIENHSHSRTGFVTAMYVCLCNGHRDWELRALAAEGVSCVHDAYRRLGADPTCGQCLDFAQNILDESQGGPPKVSRAKLPNASRAADAGFTPVPDTP